MHGVTSTLQIKHPSSTSNSLQNTNTPDINLERDLIAPGIEEELVLGMEAAEINADRRFVVNISTIVISALLFLMILAWFSFIEAAFYLWLAPDSEDVIVNSSVKLWYAIFVTIVILILIVLIYYHSRNNIK